MSYTVHRFFRDRPGPPSVVRTGLSKEEALLHCRDPETSSSTCRGQVGRDRTRKHGPWYEGWTLER